MLKSMVVGRVVDTPKGLSCPSKQGEGLTTEEKSLGASLEACGEGLKEELPDILCFAALILIALLEILQRGSRLRLPLSNFYSGIISF